ncbi:MAG: VCBS repeat-containing protein [Planctomycetes bacterium]|nr:VCBS repeat-containing protein [Planctomycetota bacterium]
MTTRFLLTTAVLLFAAAATAQPAVNSLSPTRHDTDAAPGTNVTAGFSANMATPPAGAFRLRSNMRGTLPGAYSGGGTSQLSFNPTANLLPGEEIEVSLTTALTSSQSVPLATAHVWRFRAAAGQTTARFDRRGWNTGLTSGWDTELGDLDNDGDLDLVCVTNGQSYFYLNDGSGNFTSSALGTPDGSQACELADIDNDGDLDIIVANARWSTSTGQYPGQSLIYLNNGSAGFSSTVNLGLVGQYALDIAVGDLDGDGDTDIVIGRGSVQVEPNDVYINNGGGSFTRKGVLVTPGYPAEYGDNTWAVRLADADNDGDLDLFTANFDFGPTQSYMFLNNGSGDFDYLQHSVAIGAPAIALGMEVADFNGDGRVDIAFGHLGQPAMSTYDRVTVYYNGGGTTYSSPQVMSASGFPYGVEAADVDGDGDLDLAIGLEGGQCYVLVNSGTNFSSVLALGSGSTTAHKLALGDVDGDGDLDCAGPDRVYYNGSNPPLFNVWTAAGTVTNGATVNVSYGQTLSSLGLNILCSDSDGDNIEVTGTVSNVTTQGILNSEFSKANAPAPSMLNPTTGTFNQGGANHTVSLTCQDGTETTLFSFQIVVGPAPNVAPTLTVSSSSGNVVNNATLNVAHGTSLASLGLQISVNDANGHNVSVAGTVSASTGTGMLNSEFSSASAPVAYQLTPTTGTFSQGSTLHVVNLQASDGNGGNAAFSFSIQVGAAPLPGIELHEGTAAGNTIVHGSAAAGGRDFGSQDVTQGATAALTVVIVNTGNAALSVSGIALTGTNAGEFVLNTTGTAASVQPGNNTSFSIAFDPASPGAKSAGVTLTHNGSGTANPFTFAIAGVGTSVATAPVMVVRQGSTAGPVLGNGSSLPLGNYDLGFISTPVTIVVENAGNADLQLGVPGLSGNAPGQFTADTTGMLAVVPAGQSTSFTVQYLTGTVGVHDAVLAFTHNDASTSTPFTLDLSATTNGTSGQGNSSSSSGGGGGCTTAPASGAWLLCLLPAIALLRRRKRAS